MSSNQTQDELAYFLKFFTPQIQFQIKQATISRLKQKLHSGYEKFNKGEFECLIASFIVMMCAPQPNISSYFESAGLFEYPFIQEMFSNYDIKMYLASLSFYDRDQPDEDTDDDGSISETEDEEAVVRHVEENSEVEDDTIQIEQIEGPIIKDETNATNITAMLINKFIDQVEDLFIKHMPDISYISVDESLIPCRCRCGHIVYMPQKPHKYGTLIRCACCAKTGYCISLFLHQRNIKYTCEGIFQRLLQNLPKKKFHLITDNYYSTNNSFEFCLNSRIPYVSTIRSNRFSDVRTNKELQLGQYIELSKTSQHNNFYLTTYQATKTKRVNIAHTFSFANIQQPQIWYDASCIKPPVVQYYNYYTRGVDLMDMFVSMTHWAHRSRRWPVKIFFHCLSIMLHNAFVLWKINNLTKTTFIEYCFTVAIKLKELHFVSQEKLVYGLHRAFEKKHQSLNLLKMKLFNGQRTVTCSYCNKRTTVSCKCGQRVCTKCFSLHIVRISHQHLE
ncbi:Transposase_IS4 [Hexamita inflata]|uniref:Transposase_IS4 n=1 Tax=Hexamita inflata TaxID=28002 RepID=A0ABP1HWR8_9EUKA